MQNMVKCFILTPTELVLVFSSLRFNRIQRRAVLCAACVLEECKHMLSQLL